MEITKIFGTNVKRIREHKNWSQDRLSEECGLHRTYISGIERGIRNPTIKIVAQISLALHVLPSELLIFVNERV